MRLCGGARCARQCSFGVIAGFFMGVTGIGALTSCSSDEELAPVTKISAQYAARGAGGSFAAPLYYDWAEDLNTLYAAPRYVFDGVGSAEGIAAFVAGEVDFGASDIALTVSQRALLARPMLSIPMTAGVIAIAYNIGDVKNSLRLSREGLHAIFSGQVTQWDDPMLVALNPRLTLPSESINLVVRDVNSGLSAALSGHLSRISEQWRQSYPDVFTPIAWPVSAVVVDSNAGAAEAVASTPYSLGYVDFGVASELALSMAQLENQAGKYIAPSVDAGLVAIETAVAEQPTALVFDVFDPGAHGAYPLVVVSSVYFFQEYEQADKAQAIRLWIAHGLADEQQATGAALGYIPLPERLLETARDAARDNDRLGPH